MNNNDFSRLSYKELQALALRYRVPGNIKKKLLVKVLQAAKIGNEAEVNRLLHDLKQARKKRVRKVKQKIGVTSTPVDSPSYIMADDYYCPQQQPPYQWVGAEEEIASREDDSRIPNYEEFRQFLVRRIQKEFQSFDSNNNPLQESTVVDLRTVGEPQNVHPVSTDVCTYADSNILTVSKTNVFTLPSGDHIQYHVLDDTNGNSQGSILLKKMLQAPAGANLGEIASPVLGSYRVWSIDQPRNNDIFDDSDTLTAESEKDETEDTIINNVEYNSLMNTGKNDYFLNTTFVKNFDDFNQQYTNLISTDNQYRYTYTDIENHQSSQNWSNTVGTSDLNNCIPPDIEASNAFQTVYYGSVASDYMNKNTNLDIPDCQYQVTANAPYNANQDTLPTDPLAENVDYSQTNFMQNVHTDPLNPYSLQDLTKQMSTMKPDYFTQMPDTSRSLNSFMTASAQQFATDFQPSTEITYQNIPTGNQQNDICATTSFKESQGYHDNRTQAVSLNKGQNESTESYSNGTIGSFWPSWQKNSTKNSLENLLNVQTSSSIDYTKLDQTSSVYCYAAPIITQKSGPSDAYAQQNTRKYVAERREHTLSTRWLLYDDTSFGMRLANSRPIVDDSIHSDASVHEMQISSSNENSDVNEDDCKVSINDVWIHDFKRDSSPQRKISQHDDTNSSDLNADDLTATCFFSGISADITDSQIDNI